MRPTESLRVSWAQRFVCRLTRAFRVLSCGGRRKTRSRKVSPVMGVVHKGPQFHYQRRKPNVLEEEVEGGRTNRYFVDFSDNDNYVAPPRRDSSTPPPIKVWSVQEIVAIFRGNHELSNNFVFQKQLGSGSFSVVCKATHKVTRETVAIKIISKKDLQLKNDVHRIDREMENMSRIDHPHVVKVFQTIHTPEMAFLIMEYCSGGDLFDKIVNQHRVEEDEAKNIFKQIVSAVVHLHKLSIHHRDLKPENILLESHDSSNFIKLIDFNLSIHRTNKESLCSTPCGTVDYAAPEIFKCGDYDPLYSESWSLGILLYALLVSEFPFTNHNRRSEMEKESFPLPAYLSHSARDLISRILKFEPKKRLTPVEMLTHPWLTSSPVSIARIDGSCGDDLLRISESLDSSIVHEEVIRITGDLMQKGMAEVRKTVEEGDRNSPIFCTYSIVSRKKRLLEHGEFTSWLNRIQRRSTNRRTRSCRSLRVRKNNNNPDYPYATFTVS